MNAAQITLSAESFVPAEIDAVWQLLVDPQRMPEWDVNVGMVEGAPDKLETGSIWRTYTRTHQPDGKPSKVKPAYAKQDVELVSFAEPYGIGWKFSFPDAPKANTRLVDIELSPASGGTQARVRCSWERDAKRASIPLLRWVMRPLVRFSLWMQVQHISGGISRVFRSE